MEMSTDLSRLFRRQLPAGVRNALPALVSQPPADRSVADAQLGRELLRGDRLGHVLNLVAERPCPEGRSVALASGRVLRPQSAPALPDCDERALRLAKLPLWCGSPVT